MSYFPDLMYRVSQNIVNSSATDKTCVVPIAAQELFYDPEDIEMSMANSMLTYVPPGEQSNITVNDTSFDGYILSSDFVYSPDNKSMIMTNDNSGMFVIGVRRNIQLDIDFITVATAGYQNSMPSEGQHNPLLYLIHLRTNETYAAYGMIGSASIPIYLSKGDALLITMAPPMSNNLASMSFPDESSYITLTRLSQQ